jgi:transcription elongation factor GreA
MNDTNIVTQEGFNKLQEEIRVLRDEKRPVAVARLKKAREMGDLSENSEYTSAKEDLVMLDGRIMEIEGRLRTAKIVEHTNHGDMVEIGDTVSVDHNGQKMEFIVVGELEADVALRKISNTSPIGKALLKKRKGDNVEIVTPGGKTVYKIVSIQ